MTKRYLFGEWVESEEALGADDIASICRLAEQRVRETAAYPLHKVYDLLEKVRSKWADPQYKHRVNMKKVLPDELGFSDQMVELGLERVAMILDPMVLKKKVDTEFQAIPRTCGYKFNHESHTGMRWYPLGTLLHVLAGNGFLGAASSLLEGMLTGNVNILKMASGRTSFLTALLESIKECDDDGVIARSIAAIEYPSAASEVIAELKKRVDGIVVWGGEAAVRGYRDGLPARTRIIVFGPKLSLGVVTAKGIEEQGLDSIAERLSMEMAIWDQSACTAPQLCYVQTEEQALSLAKALSKTLRGRQESLPAGRVQADSAVEIRKMRGLALVEEALGQGALYHAEKELGWTVTVSRNMTPDPSPLFRSIRLIPYESLSQVTEKLVDIRGYVQTIGLVAGDHEFTDVCHELGACGALRMVEMGKMSYGEVDDPHDGAYDLPQLMYLVFNRFKPRTLEHSLIDLVSDHERGSWIDERISELCYRARYSENLQMVFDGKKIESRGELSQLPVMTSDSPIRQVSGAKIVGGYVSRSGGSTGTPKFSVYDGEDWAAMIERSVDVLRAAGLKKGDRVANCLSAGDLYGGFVSFDHINCQLGAVSFAFAATDNAEALLNTWREFRFNVMQGMPSHLIPLLRQVRELDSDFTFETYIYGGMPLMPADEKWLRSELGVKRIAAILGANDGGPIGYQCAHLSGRKYHLADDYNFVEIVDRQGALVADGEKGRILLTSLQKYKSPLIRYEIGDMGRIVPEKCDCGRTSRVLEFLGRKEDSFEWQGRPFAFVEIVDALKAFSFSQLQIVLRDNGLLLRLEGEGDIDAGRVRADFSRIVGTECQIETYNVGGIPRNKGSVKIRGIVDERSVERG